MRFRTFLVLMGLLLILFSYTSAQVPQLINYQGKLTTSTGAPVNDTLPIIFSIYADEGGTTLLWTETQGAVIIDKGIFNVLLGSVNPIPYSVFDGSTRYLGVKVGGDPEITPRKPMVSVPYAYRSATGAGDNDWTINGDTIYHLNGYVGIGTTSPAQKLDVVGTAQVTGFKMPTGATSSYVLTSDATGVGTWQSAPGGISGSGTSSYVPKFTASTTLGNSVLFDSGGNVGIGTTSPNEQLELTGNFRLPPSTASVGVIKSGANRFIHNFGTDNFFAGVNMRATSRYRAQAVTLVWVGMPSKLSPRDTTTRL